MAEREKDEWKNKRKNECWKLETPKQDNNDQLNESHCYLKSNE
jgi:hypothetical protein